MCAPQGAAGRLDDRAVRLPSLRLSLLARFALLSLAPTLLLGPVIARDLRRSTRAEAITDARTVGKLTARLRIQPLLDPRDLRAPLAGSAPGG
jgi:hypothetical protein